jgi:hypothetical protein
MVKVHSHGKTPEQPGKPTKKGVSRDELSAALTTGPAAGGVIKKNVPNYRAVLGAMRPLKDRAKRAPTNRSAGKADHVASVVLRNKGFKTLVAPRLRGTTPL